VSIYDPVDVSRIVILEMPENWKIKPKRKRGNDTRRHELYGTWAQMRQRCNNPNATNFARFGGKGVRMFAPWNTSYGGALAFIQWVEVNLGPRPEGHELGRIDKAGNYVPGNLRWATSAEQNRTRRNVIANKHRLTSTK